MKSFSSLLAHLLALAVLCASLPSCDVHEWPVEEFGDVEYLLDLRFEGDMPLYEEVTYSRADFSTLDNESRALLYSHDVRYIVNAYPAAAISKKRSAASPERTFVFTALSGTGLDRHVRLNLPEGTWDLYVWTDYVEANTTHDKYYDTSDFANIVYPDRESYSGSNLCRDAFRGAVTVKVTHPYRFLENQTLPDYISTVYMHRPLARYEFISTDVDEFIKYLSAYWAGKGESRGGTDSRALSRSDLENFRVVFRYNTYMPSAYNAFTDLPVDSWTGMSFESTMDINDEGIVLGFDHMFIEDGTGGVNVSVEVYNEDNEKIAQTPSIDVPLQRGKYTVVKGEFLSSFSTGGVIVNPGFDGDYNIEIR